MTVARILAFMLVTLPALAAEYAGTAMLGKAYDTAENCCGCDSGGNGSQSGCCNKDSNACASAHCYGGVCHSYTCATPCPETRHDEYGLTNSQKADLEVSEALGIVIAGFVLIAIITAHFGGFTSSKQGATPGIRDRGTSTPTAASPPAPPASL
jgi:hypothetical protein